VRTRYLQANPARVVERDAYVPKPRRPLTPEIRARLVALANPQLRPYVLLAEHLLGRGRSLRDLREKDIDVDANEVTFRSTKNGDDT